jgi:Fe-S cluster assembly iron-binding protein IscA
MLKAEIRGEYDFSRAKDALVVSNELNQRVALFLDENRKGDVIRVAVDLPNCSGTRAYAINFDWLMDHLRHLEPERAP